MLGMNTDLIFISEDMAITQLFLIFLHLSERCDDFSNVAQYVKSLGMLKDRNTLQDTDSN